MNILFRVLVAALAVFVAAYILPGVHVSGFVAALIAAIVLGGVNTFLRPVLVLLTFPVTLVTLGLFLLVINALLVELAAWVVPGFAVDNFGWALLFSIIVSIISWFLNRLA